MKRSTQANLLLLLVTAFWGLTFPLIHDAVKEINPGLFVVVRCLLAAGILLPFMWREFKHSGRYILWGGVLIGLTNAGTYVFQSIGLETIGASRAAFLTGLSVVIVPFLMPLFRLGKPSKLDVLSALLCLLGLYVLTGSSLHSISTGDVWIIACAISYALMILFLQRFSERTENYGLLTFYQILFTVPFAGLYAANGHWHNIWHLQVIIAILFCAIIATSLAIYLQTRFQQYTTASKAAVIFAMEPVFAMMFSALFFGEKITVNILIGGAIILISIILPEILKRLYANSQ